MAEIQCGQDAQLIKSNCKNAVNCSCLDKSRARFLLCFSKASVTVLSAEVVHEYGTIRKSVGVDERYFPAVAFRYLHQTFRASLEGLPDTCDGNLKCRGPLMAV